MGLGAEGLRDVEARDVGIGDADQGVVLAWPRKESGATRWHRAMSRPRSNAAGRTDRAHYQRIADRSAFKRWGQPEDIAGAVAFLCMPASQYATGTVVAWMAGFRRGEGEAICSCRGAIDCFAEPVIGRAFARPVGSQ